MPTINRKHHEFDLMVSAGSITDHRAVNIFGFNDTVGTEYVALWENAAAYVYPGSALAMTAVSDSASDTAVTTAAGGGMQAPKHPADIRGEQPSIYPGRVYGAR